MYESRRKLKRLAIKGVKSGENTTNQPHPAYKDVIRMGDVPNRVLTPLIPVTNMKRRILHLCYVRHLSYVIRVRKVEIKNVLLNNIQLIASLR